MILGIDPGNEGAFVLTDGDRITTYPMPLIVHGKIKEIDFNAVVAILKLMQTWPGGVHVYLERAIPFAMGSKHAFNYGRGFAALEIAVALARLPVTYVEPAKWTKVMHEGISNDLKPKMKSLIAVERLYPKLVKSLPITPKSKKLKDGFVDALLIAGYGLREQGKSVSKRKSKDVYDFT